MVITDPKTWGGLDASRLLNPETLENLFDITQQQLSNINTGNFDQQPLTESGSAFIPAPSSANSRSLLKLISHENKPGEHYKCRTCGKLYRWKNSLYTHVRLECGKEPQFQCPYCPHRAKLKGNLQKHIKLKHFQEIS